VQTGDWVISDGNTWGKIDNTDAVKSVNGQTGVVNLGYEDLGDMPEATDTEVGGIMLGFVGGLDADLLDGKHASDFADVNHTHDYSASNHNHNDTYLGLTATAADSDKLGDQLPSYYEPAFSKNTAFNKDFGTGSNDVASGDHGHTELHTHDNKTVLDAFTTALKTSYDGAVTNSHTHGNNLSGTNTGDETTQRIGNLINSAMAKAIPVDDDMVGLMDSAAGNILKKWSWRRIKEALEDYFDTVYAKLAYSRIRINSTNIPATSSGDTITFQAGTNITLTPDVSGKKVTIAAGGGGGGSSYREIKVNYTTVLDSANNSPINICDGVGTIVGGGWAAGERVIYISTHLGNLEDPINGIDLQRLGMAPGIWALIPGQSYLNTPNPICGTDIDSINLSGTYTYVVNDSGGTWTYHDHNTNKMYISSWYIDPVNGDTLNPWKRLLTCTDEIPTEPEEVKRYEYLINDSYQIIHIDSNTFDFKRDMIVIDLATLNSTQVVKININIHFNPITGSPVHVDIIDSSNTKPVNFGSSNVYTNPATVSSIYLIEYEIWNFNPYWLVGNRIY
jgi:hypothetical protein